MGMLHRFLWARQGLYKYVLARPVASLTVPRSTQAITASNVTVQGTRRAHMSRHIVDSDAKVERRFRRPFPAAKHFNGCGYLYGRQE